MKPTIFAAICTSLLLLSPTVFAQVPPEIEAEHRRGMALRTEHQDEAARAIFEGIFNLTHEPRARARQALAEQALGQYGEAETHLVEALSNRDDPWIRQNRSVLEPILSQARESQGIAVLHVTCEAPNAEIFVNGNSAGRANELIRLPPGTITFEVRAAGYSTASRTITLQSGASPTEEVVLVRIAETQRITRSGTREARPVAAPWPWFGVGLAVGGVGIGTLVAGGVLYANAADVARRFGPVAMGGQGCPVPPSAGACTMLAEEFNTLSSVGIGLLVTGGVLVAGGVVLVALPRPAAVGSVRVALRPTLGVDGHVDPLDSDQQRADHV